MAVTVASLQAVLELDTRKFKQNINAAEKALDKVDRGLPEVGKSADKLGNSLDKMGSEGKQAFEDMEAGADNAKGSIGALFTRLGGAGLALGGLTAIVGGVVAVGKAVFDMSQEFNGAMRTIEARTGKTGAELESLGDTVMDVYRDNWGDNLSDVADAIVTVNQQLGETGEALESSAKSALIMRDVFDMDIRESVRAVDVAVQAFGVNSQTVFDAMAKVIQTVGDPADDLADTINEYGPLFAQMGFSFEEMMGILQRGLEEGARNFDVIGDAVKEFGIRIMDGSDTTEEALHNLFEATDQGSQEFDNLIDQLDNTNDALERNQDALAESEGAYDAQKKVVEGLQGALDTARRELEKLARPNLKGMEEFDDQLFELEQRAKRAELALLDLEPDSRAYETTREELDKINKEIDRVSLRRDLIFDEQLRNLEKAVNAATEETLTYEEALDRVGLRVGEIELLEQALAENKDTLGEMARNTSALEQENANLISDIETLTEKVANFETPARQMLEGLASGETTARDAMSRVIQMLQQVDDKVLQNQIGVALFGTKWEDLGPQIILALDPAQNKLEEFAGTVDAAGEAVSSGLGAQLSGVWRDIKANMLPVLDELGQNEEVQKFISGLVPVFERFSNSLNDTIIPAITLINQALTDMARYMGEGNEELSLSEVLLWGLEKVLGTITTGIQIASLAFVGLTRVITIVDALIDKAREKWNGFGDTLSDIGDKIPDWLKPGSPAPLEIALGGIKRQLDQMPNIGDALGFSQPIAAGGGGATNNTTINMGGQSFAFSGDNATDQALVAMLQMLRAELSR